MQFLSQIVHSTLGLMTLVDHDVKITNRMPSEPTQRWYISQIQTHISCALLEEQPFCQTMMYTFSTRWI
jgi:hypothetical protein